MAKKKDVIARILENHPEIEYSKEQLDENFTIQELENYEESLNAGTPGSPNSDEAPETESSDQPEAEPTVDDNGVPKDISAEEKAALEVQQASAQGETVSKKFKLADPDTQYAEPGFTLQGNQEKALPENPSAELIQRIRAGFIKEV